MKRSELKAKAKEQIEGRIGVLFLITLVISLITTMTSLVLELIAIFFPLLRYFTAIVSVIIVPAFSLSIVRVYLMLLRDEDPAVEDAFTGFNDFQSAFKVMCLVGLYTFLWSLLLIVPGIVKSISYSMSMHVLAENKGKSARECIKESEAMTKGHKAELFMLNLSFIGWHLAGFLTFGIATVLWVTPYMNATFANAYESLKTSAAAVDSPVENDGLRRRKSLISHKKSTQTE